VRAAVISLSEVDTSTVPGCHVKASANSKGLGSVPSEINRLQLDLDDMAGQIGSADTDNTCLVDIDLAGPSSPEAATH